MIKSIVLLLLIGNSFSAFSFSKNNDPKVISKNFQRHFRMLPLAGELSADRTPWTSSFWPHVYGGIAFRWNHFYSEVPEFAPLHVEVSKLWGEYYKLYESLFKSNVTFEQESVILQQMEMNEHKRQKLNKEKAKFYKKYFFDIVRPQSLADVRMMSQEQLDQLSPAEKFDLYKGDYGLTLTKNVLKLTGPDRPYWMGICNGWTSASLEFVEPEPITISNKDGVQINFGSSDLKALLSYYHAAMTNNYFARKRNIVARVGERCKTTFPAEAWFIGDDGKEYYRSVEQGKIVIKKVPKECMDSDAGAFHIVLTNMLGLENRGFVAEIVRDEEVWNQPVYKFESEVVEELANTVMNPVRRTVRQVKIKTTIYYTNDGGRMFWQTEEPEDAFYAWWQPTNGTDNFHFGKATYLYLLDLNKHDEIIGGHWLSYDRPDFLWVKKTKGFIGKKGGPFGYGIVSYMDELKNLVQLQKE